MAELTWEIAEPETLTFDDPVTAVSVRIVNGTVNIVGTDEAVLTAQGGARLEISQVEGVPLTVTRSGSTLTVTYRDLSWQNFLRWLDHRSRHRSAVVSLTVPAGAAVEVAVVGAGAVISGMQGRTELRGVSGDATLVGLSGSVRAETVTGSLEAQAVTGDLRFHSVSGDLTVVEGSGASVRAESVSGDMVIDLDPFASPTDIRLATVSGEVAIRLPYPADAKVEANTASGSVSSAFEDLRVTGQWGAKKLTGTLGAGTGTLKATTASGSITLLRRPPADDPPGAERAGGTPADTKEL